MSRSSDQRRPSVPETNGQLACDPRKSIEQWGTYLQAPFAGLCTNILDNLLQLINVTALRLEVELMLLGRLWW